MSGEPVTVAALRRCRFALLLHANMGAQGHYYLSRCVEHPAFTVARHSWRNPRRIERSYFVGEQAMPDLQAVADALNAQAGAVTTGTA